MDQQQRFETLAQRVNSFNGQKRSQMQIFSPMHAGLAQEYIQDAATLQAEVQRLQNDWTSENTDQEFLHEVILPYFKTLLDSLSAHLELNAENGMMPSDKRFDLLVRADGYTIADIGNPFEALDEATDAFLDVQPTMKDFDPDFVNPQRSEHYREEVLVIKNKLDREAAKFFGVPIHTPTKIDLKERNPHQFLGEINVGFENYVPSLVRLIAHEGPFGHNTHFELSQRAESRGYSVPFRHALEGVAIYGEQLGIGAFYSEEQEGLNNLLNAKRRHMDAVVAAFEYGAFYEGLPEDQLAEKLAGRGRPKEMIRKQIRGLDERREANVSAGGTAYFVGARNVEDTINAARDTLSETFEGEELDARLNRLVQSMYEGIKPAGTLKAQIGFNAERFVEQRKHDEAQGVVRSEQPSQYSI